MEKHETKIICDNCKHVIDKKYKYIAVYNRDGGFAAVQETANGCDRKVQYLMESRRYDFCSNECMEEFFIKKFKELTSIFRIGRNKNIDFNVGGD